jgi:hypothetical protein
MRLSPASALSLVTLAGALLSCAPVPDADAPLDEDERPCRSHDDCDVRAAQSGPRQQLCGTRGIHWDSSPNGKDAAACGPMPGMSPNIPEPLLMCFRGTCVPVGKSR